MATISTCLIVKNERERIERCIKSIQSFSDEIIIYDTGSDDGTQEFCKTFDKVRVIQGKWVNDFAWARNESFSRAKCDYIMWIDADDIIEEESQKWLLNFKNGDMSKYEEVYIEYFYSASKDEGPGTFHFYRGRIFKRLLRPMWHGRIHEYVENEKSNGGESLYLKADDCRILHYKHPLDALRNYNIFKEMEREGAAMTGRDWFYFGNEAMNNGYFDEAIEKFENAINSKDIWYVDKLNALVKLFDIYKDNKQDYNSAMERIYRAAGLTMIPRADVCYRIGDIYRELGEIEWGKMWTMKAIENRPKDNLEGTFLDDKYFTWYPCLNMCLLTWAEGDKEESNKWNEKVLEYDPENEAGLNNRKFFNGE